MIYYKPFKQIFHLCYNTERRRDKVQSGKIPFGLYERQVQRYFRGVGLYAAATNTQPRQGETFALLV